METLIGKLESCRVETEADLTFVEVGDLIPPLNTIQARKLTSVWKSEYMYRKDPIRTVLPV